MKKNSKYADSFFARLATAVYKWNYGFGMYVLTHLHRAARHWKKELRPMQAWFRTYFMRTVLTWWHRLAHKFQIVGSSFREVFAQDNIPFFRHPLAALREFGNRIHAVFERHPGVFHKTYAVAAPLAAVLVLVLTLSYWTSAKFGIEVEYEGTDVGCISDETTYHEAADLARSRVYSADGEFTISDTPKMTVTLVRAEPMLSTAALCDEILRTKGDAIAEASGLYVDGGFVGSVESRTELETVLDEIKKSYCTGSENERAEFIQSVEIIDGLFLSNSVISSENMQKKLTSQALAKKEYVVQTGDTLSGIARKLDMTISDLRAMNTTIQNDTIYAGQTLIVQRPQPFLRVKVVRTISYTEVIPFGTEKIQNPNQPVTYQKVKTAGVNGSQQVTAEVTYVDGVEQSRNILSIDVIKNAVTKVVEVGTKKVIVSNHEVVIGDGVTTGSMLWPVPICHNMSRGYGRGHYALDICNGPVTVRGKPAVAADGGVVSFSGYKGAMGYVVIIDHNNGYVTYYEHNSSLLVSAGQTVYKGQQVAKAGRSGVASGVHCHFGIQRNGSYVNPLNYLS